MRSSAATAFVNSESTFAGFQPVGKLRQKKLRTVLRFSFWFRKLFFEKFMVLDGVMSLLDEMSSNLNECKSKSEAHGGDKLMTLLKPLKGWVMACGYSPPWT
ncbi:hypothetical protein [Absidia glauca]|uniref:Uncharacterized protein n=1 Tax=Absidia glauca TaxID=4829 RepID=A0A163J2C0_ABSGL|nr:hypothetical protein [Absidia glauca]